MIHFNKEHLCLEGNEIKYSQPKLGSYAEYYQELTELDDPEKVIYEVEYHDNGLKEGDEGGLFWGISHVMPGTIGDEYHMTKVPSSSKKGDRRILLGLKRRRLVTACFC
ncbi:glucose-6-phosphate isomerase family protein [Enterococcus termitis]